VAAALCLAAVAPAAAHVSKASGDFRVEVGWGAEPAFSGQQNFVDVSVARRSGGAVGADASLSVQASFAGQVVTLPLVTTGAPGRFRAPLVPTRPGTYGFHVMGTVRGSQVDVEATCSERTFDCVRPASDVEFPAAGPSGGELATRLTRELRRSERARDDADAARTLAIVAIAVAAVALGLAAGLGLRRRTRG
jgi:hypothetical protein